jgi:hypothetical protein
VTSVELSILAWPGDLGFAEPTIRHQLRTFAACSAIGHRVLVLDIRDSSEGARRLSDLGARLLQEGLLDEVRPVEWGEDAVRASMQRWYGHADASPKAARERAIHQYAFTVDSARAPLVLHLDSDVLFHGDACWWLDAAVERLAGEAAVAAVMVNGAVPRAHRPVEWAFGRRVLRRRWAEGWQDGPDVSSRGVLLHRDRVLASLPLDRPDPSEQWEASLSRGLRHGGFHRSTLVDDRFQMLHPLDQNRAHPRLVAALVAQVEAGRIPFRRFGKPWDITTRGWRRTPWQIARWSPWGPGARSTRH